MSRSKNSRRGTRQKLPPFLAAEIQEMRDLNTLRMGAPRASDARRLQGANDAVSPDPIAEANADFEDDLDRTFAHEGPPGWFEWEEWKERQAS